ncbi:MAG: hypothetical protein AN485_22620, partial [Anabaena sp. MDT14b]
TCFATRELRHVRIFLLRHDGTAGGETVGNAHKTEVLAHPQNQLFTEAADVHHAQAGRSGEFDGEVAVAHAVQAVLANLCVAVFVDHAQGAGYAFAVQRVGGARQSCRAQRQAVGAAAHVAHALGIPTEHLDIGQQMVRKAHRLGHLQVGEARHDDFDVLLSHLDQRLLQVGQQIDDQVHLAAQPQAHVGGHLVIAAATRVQAFARVAHQLGQPRFNVQVHVFEVQFPFKSARFDLLGDLRHAALNVGQVARADDVLRGQHLGVGQAAGDVGLPQAFVKEHAGGVALDQLAHGFRKERRPGLGFFVEL